ncbi:MAG: 3-hydroxyacyl-CoA dehydrogenase [Caedimonadaceae bacterium]|nr:MAG: 3-hydroxyacyl-CoA dehydrogenase [Caedimonadaceae bacterium]
MTEIKKAAVIGAGVMGASIAAHLTNAGIPVLLLDIPQSGFGKKNALAEGAIEKLLKMDPAPFMHKSNAEMVIPGNIESDLSKLSDCDWIIEAVVEKIDIKQDLFKKIQQYKKPDAIVSSNTSTIPLKKLIEGMDEAFQESFMITHFFNPPRYMRLLEIVKGPKTKEAHYQRISRFADVSLGKGVVECKDTPGFIANRIGVYWLQTGMMGAVDAGLSVEEADAVLGKPMGIPKMGVFGLVDLVGLDLIPLIGGIMRQTLSPEDPYCKNYRVADLFLKMIDDGYTGRKGKGGFYRLNTDDGKKVKESINLQTGVYAPTKKAVLQSLSEAGNNIQKLLSHTDKGGKYAWTVMSEVLNYALSLVGEIADDVVAIDNAMKMGYNWKWGPFELLDRIGPAWFAEKLSAEGREVPDLLKKVGAGTFYRVDNQHLQYFDRDGQYKDVKRPEGVLLLSDIKLRTKPLAKNPSASLWDIGDGVVCIEFHSKMNAIDPLIMQMMRKAKEIVEKDYKALVIYNEGSNFSAGANIGLALFVANIGLWQSLDDFIGEGQQTLKSLKYAPFPVVAAPSGMAIGGGCEVVLHADAIQAHAESYIGLVEVGVGLVPSWGGCKEMLTRWLTSSNRPGGSMVAVGKIFEIIGTAQVAKSAFEAKEKLFLREADTITMNRDRLLYDAKQKALNLAKDYSPPKEQELSLPGAGAKVALNMAVKGFVKIGKASPYDEEVAKKLADVLCGGDSDITDKNGEDRILELERHAFMTLVRNPKTLARMEHILETGKPLRN